MSDLFPKGGPRANASGIEVLGLDGIQGPGVNSDLAGLVKLWAQLTGHQRVRPDTLEGIAELLRRSHVRTIHAGERFVHEGWEDDPVYIIRRGSLSIERQSPTGPIPIITRGPCEVVGEMAALLGTGRTCTIRAQTESEVLVMPSTAFLEFLAANPGLKIAVWEEIDRRVDVLQEAYAHHMPVNTTTCEKQLRSMLRLCGATRGQTMLEHLRELEDKTVVELFCGVHGKVVKALVQLGVKDVRGFDTEIKMPMMNGHLLPGDARDLQMIPDDSVDVLLTFNFLADDDPIQRYVDGRFQDFAPTPEDIMQFGREAARIIKPGGDYRIMNNGVPGLIGRALEGHGFAGGRIGPGLYEFRKGAG